jgi:hypothetical protein
LEKKIGFRIRRLNLMKLFGMIVLLLGVAGIALANPTYGVPEIDPGSGAMAVSLLGGSLLVLRGRKKR